MNRKVFFIWFVVGLFLCGYFILYDRDLTDEKYDQLVSYPVKVNDSIKNIYEGHNPAIRNQHVSTPETLTSALVGNVKLSWKQKNESVLIDDSADESAFQSAFYYLVRDSDDVDFNYLDWLVNQYSHYYIANNADKAEVSSVEAISGIIDALASKGKFSAAVDYGKRFESSMSGNVDYQLSLAQAYGDLASSTDKDYAKAIAILESIDSPSDNVLFVVGQYYKYSGNNDGYHRVINDLKKMNSKFVTDLISMQ